MCVLFHFMRSDEQVNGCASDENKNGFHKHLYGNAFECE